MVIFDFLKKHVSEMVAICTETLYHCPNDVYYNNYKVSALGIIAFADHPLAECIAEATRQYDAKDFGKFIRYLDMQLGKATGVEMANLKDSLQKWLKSNEFFDFIIADS